MSRSTWAWTKSGYGRLACAFSSSGATVRVATAVLLMLALCPAAALGNVGKPHPGESAASTTRPSRSAGTTHSTSHNQRSPHAARPRGHRRSSSREPLALGSGYSAPHGLNAVKVVQRSLGRAGFSPGPIDGRYGPLTQRAVIGFQAAHGLRVDGIAGPITRRALAGAEPVLRPGAGDVRGGSPSVRKLQRRLAAAGYRPGPVDGRYGPRTQRAVIRLQRARHLVPDGIAGPQTLHQLGALLTARNRTHPHRPGARPGTGHHRSRPRSGPARGAPTPTPSITPEHGRPTSSTGSSVPWVVLLACLLTAMLAVAAWRRHHTDRGHSVLVSPRPEAEPTATATDARHNHAGTPAASRPRAHGDPAAAQAVSGRADDRGRPAAAFELGVKLVLAGYRTAARTAFRRPDQRRQPHPEFDLGALLPQEENRGAAEHAFRMADDRGHAGAACNLGVLLEQRGDVTGAHDAYRRADERGHAVGAYNLGALLEQVGDLRGAKAAYRRADARGDSVGAYSLGVLLERDGDLSGARAAYQRADERGDPWAACNLGLLLMQEGDRIGAMRALQRAVEHGSEESRRAAREALLELDPVKNNQRTPDDRGKAAAVSEPDSSARPPTRRGDQAW